MTIMFRFVHQLRPFLPAAVFWLAAAMLSLPGTGARAQTSCDTLQEPTFTIRLPVLGYPPDEEGQNWPRPKVWDGYDDARDDSIVVPNGRPIYALIISGYASNPNLDELMLYNFARHLQSKGAYVHWAWWNNLLAPYMERPLHHPQSEPGDLNAHATDFVNMTADDAGRKAVPSEDYQLVADAKRFLSAIREHNPGAIVIVAGHSMGGGATVHIGAGSDELIDILAPLDPVGNRNYPFAGNDRVLADDFNWTRWRITRDNFLGYKQSDWDPDQGQCVPTGPWLYYSPNVGSTDIRCLAVMFVDQPPTVAFGPNVVNLYHRYQKEYLFPFDYGHDYNFGHVVPTNGLSSQAEVPMTPQWCGLLDRCDDPGGWPAGGDPDNACCETGDGVGWPNDGHGEIVGYRGPLPAPVPLAARARTSPMCGTGCTNLTWPYRYKNEDTDTWVNGNGALRKQLLMDLETLPAGTAWAHRPTNPALCLVSPGLITMFENMNKPPDAQAGPDQVVECTGRDGAEVTLDGSGSTDPDGDDLTFTWAWALGSASGEVAAAVFPLGKHCVTLTVRDPSGHTDEDVVIVEVVDTTPPELTVELYPSSLWPPNHKLAEILAEVRAVDLCGDVASLTLVSAVSSESDNGRGDGNTTDDIQGADVNTLDTLFGLRSERMGGGPGRRYTVTYQATDESGNRAEVSKDVVVKNSPPGRPRNLIVEYGSGEGNRLSWSASPDMDLESYAVYRSTDPSFTPGSESLVQRTAATTWTDAGTIGRDVFYALAAIDQTGLEGGAVVTGPGLLSVPVGAGELKGGKGVREGEERAADAAAADDGAGWSSGQNFPNPFNPSTVIRFSVPAAGFVRLGVYNVLGQLVAEPLNGELDAGEQEIVWNAGDAPGGVYFYRLEMPDAASPGRTATQVRKMVLIR